jgi:hypothetical protein
MANDPFWPPDQRPPDGSSVPFGYLAEMTVLAIVYRADPHLMQHAMRCRLSPKTFRRLLEETIGGRLSPDRLKEVIEDSK